MRAYSVKDCAPDVICYANRDRIVFGSTQPWAANEIKRFSDMSIQKLEALIANKLIHLGGRQNSSPSVAEFADFMRSWPCALAHGYVVSPMRPDSRISIEGLRVPKEFTGPALALEFEELCNSADECHVPDEHGDFHSWWD